MIALNIAMLFMWRYGDVSPNHAYRTHFSHHVRQVSLFFAVSRCYPPAFIRTYPSVGEWDDPTNHRNPHMPSYSSFETSLLRAVRGGRVVCFQVEYDYVNGGPFSPFLHHELRANTSTITYYINAQIDWF